jgi:creatinine amidohydrolase/Fe(II)-dependent formamide hydrolase-like protein
MSRTITVLVLALVAAGASAQTRSVYIEDLTWPEIREAQASGKTSAIIYAGGTEQNGPHMALVKHNAIAHYAAGQIAERLGTALVYPTMPFSPAGDPIEKTGHMRFPGTVTLSSEVFLGVMRQVATSAIAGGFKNVFLMGDHGGGQAELKLAAESLDADWKAKGVRVFYVADVFAKSAQQISAYLTEHQLKGGGHAGITETAQVMFVDSGRKWIRQEKFAASSAGPEPTTGVGGDPSAATADIGRVFIDYKVNDAVEAMRKLLSDR